MRCAFCQRSMDDHPNSLTRYEVTGWEKDRSKGGTNALELRNRTGAVAHSTCVDAAKRGVHVDQQTLV